MLRVYGQFALAVLSRSMPRALTLSSDPHAGPLLLSRVQTCKYVVLFFSVNGTSYFCGWAVMRSLPGQCALRSSLFKAAEDPQSASRAHFEGNTFDLEWIRR